MFTIQNSTPSRISSSSAPLKKLKASFSFPSLHSPIEPSKQNAGSLLPGRKSKILERLKKPSSDKLSMSTQEGSLHPHLNGHSELDARTQVFSDENSTWPALKWAARFFHFKTGKRLSTTLPNTPFASRLSLRSETSLKQKATNSSSKTSQIPSPISNTSTPSTTSLDNLFDQPFTSQRKPGSKAMDMLGLNTLGNDAQIEARTEESPIARNLGSEKAREFLGMEALPDIASPQADSIRANFNNPKAVSVLGEKAAFQVTDKDLMLQPKRKKLGKVIGEEEFRQALAEQTATPPAALASNSKHTATHSDQTDLYQRFADYTNSKGPEIFATQSQNLTTFTPTNTAEQAAFKMRPRSATDSILSTTPFRGLEVHASSTSKESDNEKAKKVLGIDPTSHAMEGVDFIPKRSPRQKNTDELLGGKDNGLIKLFRRLNIWASKPKPFSESTGKRSETFPLPATTASSSDNTKSLKRRSVSSPNLGDLREMSRLANAHEGNYLHSQFGKNAKKLNLAGLDGSDNSNVWGGDKNHPVTDDRW